MIELAGLKFEADSIAIELSALAISAIGLYVIAVIAYILLAYVAGSSFSKVQNIIVNVVFVSIAGLMVVGTFSFFERAHHFATLYGSFSRGYFYGLTFMLLELLGIVAALIFMFEVRKQEQQIVKLN